MKEKCKNLEMEKQVQELQSLSVRCSHDGWQAQDWVRKTYMQLLAAGVSANRCATCNPNLNLNPNPIPNPNPRLNLNPNPSPNYESNLSRKESR